MADRIRIGMAYTYNENWIAGTYYIENLINALNALDDKDKPNLVIITNRRTDYNTAKNKFNYPYLSFQLGSGESHRVFQFINKISGRLIKKKLFNQKIKGLDAVFPYYKCVQQSLAKNKIYWIADFQEHFVAEFFDQDAIRYRIENQMTIQSSAEKLVLSSEDSLQHFKILYPNHTVRASVMPFAVTHPNYSNLSMSSLLQKHHLPEKYFICPNQFWAHKNQFIVLKAIKILKDKGIDIIVGFTGNTKDFRNPDYFAGLKQFVKKNDIGEQVKFLGFIDRLEQLQLMKHAVAIIQPSLFEGWSTVVEDAKAMNKSLIVSNINVHREQLINSSARFFDPLNEKDLAAALEWANDHPSLPVLYEEYDYKENIKAFGKNFLNICT